MVLKKILAKIELGIFEYREYFPNSKTADKIDQMDLKRRRIQGNATPPFEEVTEKWFKNMEPTWRSSTASGYRNYYEKHILPFWKGKEVSGITRQDILEFRSDIAKHTNENTGNRLDPATVNKTLKIFRMIINEAADEYECTSPYRNIQMLKEPKKEIHPFNLAEVHQIINHIQPEFRIFVLVRFFTGLRTGEVNGLRWKNVDFDNRVIKVRETYSEQSGFQYAKNDGPVHSNNFRCRAWKTVLKQLGIEYRSPYQSRHTYCCLLLAAGENATRVARQMGHTSTEMIFTTYGFESGDSNFFWFLPKTTFKNFQLKYN